MSEVTTGQRVTEVLDTIMASLATLKCLTCPTNVIPANDATNVSLLPTLSWSAVPGAIMYDVYFGTDPLALTLISPNQVGTTYTFVAPNHSYYWNLPITGILFLKMKQKHQPVVQYLHLVQ